MTELLTTPDVKRLMEEISANTNLPAEEELAAWGIEPIAFYDVAKFMIFRTAGCLKTTRDYDGCLGSFAYVFFSLGVKVAMEAEMRRMAESGYLTPEG